MTTGKRSSYSKDDEDPTYPKKKSKTELMIVEVQQQKCKDSFEHHMKYLSDSWKGRSERTEADLTRLVIKPAFEHGFMTSSLGEQHYSKELVEGSTKLLNCIWPNLEKGTRCYFEMLSKMTVEEKDNILQISLKLTNEEFEKYKHKNDEEK